MTEVEILWDPQVALFHSGTELDPSVHEVLDDGEYVQWLQRQLKMPYIFCYFHKIHRTFVLAGWIIDRQVFSELRVLEGPPDSIWTFRPRLAEMQHQTRDARERMRDLMEIQRQKESAKRRQQETEKEELRDAIKLAKKKGLESTAQGLQSGAMPFAGASTVGQERIDAWKDAFGTLAKGL